MHINNQSSMLWNRMRQQLHAQIWLGCVCQLTDCPLIPFLNKAILYYKKHQYSCPKPPNHHKATTDKFQSSVFFSWQMAQHSRDQIFSILYIFVSKPQIWSYSILYFVWLNYCQRSSTQKCKMGYECRSWQCLAQSSFALHPGTANDTVCLQVSSVCCIRRPARD